MEINIPIKKKEHVYKAILQVINFSLRMTEKEVNMVSELLKNNITLIDTRARRLLHNNDKNEIHNVNNYIKNLIVKGVLVKQGRDIYINPTIIKFIGSSSLKFNFIISDNEGQSN